jgi:phosphonate transport system ATP-binding protein
MVSTEDPLLAIRDLDKTYPDGTVALSGIHLDIPAGQLVAVIGPSGAGKSTLLRCINRLVEPTRGEILVKGQRVTGANRAQLRAARCEIGMVFQHFNLVDRLPAVRNVLHGRLGRTGSLKGSLGIFPRAEVERALEILGQLGLGQQAFKRCADLSGGQKQRVGIGRAIMQGASLILADEPIASLDPSASETVMRSLKDVATAQHMTAVVNLHQVEFARQFADRIVGLRGGTVYCDVPTADLTEQMVRELYYGDETAPADVGPTADLADASPTESAVQDA